jgi:hypothetical protein
MTERAGAGAFFVGAARAVVVMAERVGFEPTNGGYPLPAFQASLISHSSTSPRGGLSSRRSACASDATRGQ